MSSRFRVDQVCTYTFGGAATAARRLHEGLRQIGIASHFVHGDDPRSQVDDPSYSELRFLPETKNVATAPLVKTYKRMRRRRVRRDHREHLIERPAGFEVFSPASLFYDTTPAADQLTADIIQLHWIAFFVDFATFFASIPQSKPIVWTLHDMNPFTGGCHYSSGCSAYTHGCGSCPQVANGSKDDVSIRTYKLKRKLLRGRPITVVTPSRWLAREAQRSLVFPPSTQFEIIPYGLETDVFRPHDKRMARAKLGIKGDDLIVGFGAEDLLNQRKGMKYLWEALKSTDVSEPISGLVFGEGKFQSTPEGLNRIHTTGYVSDPHQQALIYSAADVFVMPSLEDNQPQTGLEAMACGTPVVAFEAGGIPEYVRPGLTGLLAKVADSKDLANQLSWILNNSLARDEMGRKARATIETEFPLQLQAARYRSMYERILGIHSDRHVEGIANNEHPSSRADVYAQGSELPASEQPSREAA